LAQSISDLVGITVIGALFSAVHYVLVFISAADHPEKTKSNAAEKKPAQLSRPNWFFVGCGFGSLLYMTQAVFGEVSVLTRWVVSGYPYTGPVPYPWG